ncbi:MAG TPA: histidine kinase dimerization/phospho-acceptor domain-containing protein [Syntrophomonas sp.]|mgnify:CR=1 FL=1|nr:histidine kinase dimerization/phospho-acceptor domain-containing protein [Syntrophomonas sp.]
MDTKWKRFSQATITKLIVFIFAVACFSGAITPLFDAYVTHSTDFSILNEDSYYVNSDFINEITPIVNNLKKITSEYQNEDYIVSGGSLSAEEINHETEQLFEEFADTSLSYNPKLSPAENQVIFQRDYADRIARIKDQLIQDDLRDYHSIMRELGQYKGLVYYAKSGETVFTNSPSQSAGYFKSFPAYLTLEGYDQNVYPSDIQSSRNYGWLQSTMDEFGHQDIMYLALTDQFLNPRISEWKENKTLMDNSLRQIGWLVMGFFLAFLYLLWVSGRRPGEDKIYFNSLDRIYNDINLLLCTLLIIAEIGSLVALQQMKLFEFVFPVTFIIAAMGLLLVLAMVKHLKNRTFLRHTLTYVVFEKLFVFVKDVYHTGSTAVRVILVVIAYPLIAGLTFFMFPLTIGFACWLALKKVKEFNLLQAGVQEVKEGNLNHTIEIPGDSDFALLAADINHITDGLSQAVAKEVKSERLKSELITNVSHDLRTPLTSIITYVDLVKQETDPEKMQEYIEIIDQKAQRLKLLTDDLFEAAKASSGDMPVNLEKIDIVSLITQGLGELDDKVQQQKLEIKLSHPQEKMFVKADGKLLWRALENLLSNIFKYAQEGSRVYIDLEDADNEVRMTMKNISAFALNVSAEELMERFKRGDEARTSQGSGLGLSIARSLIEIQNGSFQVDIDGDLFKVTLRLESLA